SQTDGIFAYYKAFQNPGGGNPVPPPVTASTDTAYQWQKSLCDADGRGVELDWLTFWYEVNNRTSDKFTFSDIASIYDELCSGTCSGGQSQTWEILTGAVGD